MKIGTVYPSSAATYTDPVTGVRVTRLTSGNFSSYHLYFTNNGSFACGRRLIIVSERNGVPDYYAVDLSDFRQTQITAHIAGEKLSLQEGIVDGVRNELFYFRGSALTKIDLDTFSQTVLYRTEEGYGHHIVSCMEGGAYLFTSVFTEKDIPESPFAPCVPAPHPHGKILRIRRSDGKTDVLAEGDEWFAHVNVCPTDENRLTFCHEGYYHNVDHRLWGLDVDKKRIRKLAEGCPYYICHEYWLSDGEHIGFHGDDKKTPVLGITDFSGRETKCSAFRFGTGHTFTFDGQLVVGDGNADGRYLRLFRQDPKTGEYGEPIALCLHGSSFARQIAHAHPRFFPGNSRVVFTSDRGGYEQVYLAEVPEDLSVLPPLSAVSDAK